MSVKKILTLAAVGFASVGVANAALAGGAEYTPSYAGVYLEGNAGYAVRNWKNDPSTDLGVIDSISGVFTSTSNLRGGFTGGLDLGYQFNQYFSVEGGWYYLPRVRVTLNDGSNTVVRVNSGLAYGAFKVTAPVYQNTYVFAKLGAGYVYDNTNSNVFFSSTDATRLVSKSDYWNPLWAAGVQYYFNPNLSINFQYLNVAGYHRSSSNNFFTPDINIFTVGVGYKFLM